MDRVLIEDVALKGSAIEEQLSRIGRVVDQHCHTDVDLKVSVVNEGRCRKAIVMVEAK